MSCSCHIGKRGACSTCISAAARAGDSERPSPAWLGPLGPAWPGPGPAWPRGPGQPSPARPRLAQPRSAPPGLALTPLGPARPGSSTSEKQKTLIRFRWGKRHCARYRCLRKKRPSAKSAASIIRRPAPPISMLPGVEQNAWRKDGRFFRSRVHSVTGSPQH